MNWIITRLGEPSTKVALAGFFAALSAGFDGKLSWTAVLTTCVGLLIPLLTSEK